MGGPIGGGESERVRIKGEVGSHLDLSRRLDEAMHEPSRTLAVATGELSGLALQVLYGPLVEKTRTKRTTYGDLLTELNRRPLIVGASRFGRSCCRATRSMPGW